MRPPKANLIIITRSAVANCCSVCDLSSTIMIEITAKIFSNTARQHFIGTNIPGSLVMYYKIKVKKNNCLKNTLTLSTKKYSQTSEGMSTTK